MKLVPFLVLIAATCFLTGCGDTPEQLARESSRLHQELSQATTEADSSAVFRKISELETRARSQFNKEELRQYHRLAHPND